MKDEIKEILDEMKQICDVWVIMEGGVKTYNQDQIHCIYDCITNLQEENEKLNKVIISSHKELESLYNHLTKKDLNYKSRNEKAIELIKEAGCYDEETKTFCDDIWEELPKLLSILTGGDSDE